MPYEITAMPGSSEVYFRLVWLFVLIITALFFALCYLFLSMRRAEEREHSSLVFSNMMIEGMEDERRRVSRELHDTVLPLVRDPALSDTIRSICIELMPPDFARLSMKDSLAELCAKFTQRTGIQCACSIEEALSFAAISPENQLHLYRMVQESLTNIEKHSKAGRAALVARRSMHGSSNAKAAGHILICVSDEGAGLPAQFVPGLGMRSMRQRAAIVGAKLDFISESGNGLMVRIEVENKGKYKKNDN
jgi:signal transduction histidine kinase